MAMHTLSILLSTAFVLPPHMPHQRKSTPRNLACTRASFAVRASFANDGEEVDWDKEAAALVGRQSDNRFFKAIKAISAPELVSEFAQTAPRDVQLAVRATIGSLLGNMPQEVMESTISTPGKNLGTLMFSMQMTGYMFRNAEYRQSLRKSLEGGDMMLNGGEEAKALPPVSGTISVKIAEGMEAEVDAAAYMAELRSEVEGLRSQLVSLRQEQQRKDNEGGLMTFLQTLEPEEAQGLTSQVSQDVLEAMGQLVSSLLTDLNVPVDNATAITAPTTKLRELLITQLVTVCQGRLGSDAQA